MAIFLPLKDNNPLEIIPFQVVTVSLIVACVAVFLWQVSLSDAAGNSFIFAYGTIPAVLFDVKILAPELVRVPAETTLITSMFVHGSWWHLIGNMLYLWVFGDNVEDSMGHRRFVAFYLICGIAAALTHAVTEPGSATPVVGASGAISGVMGAYLVLHPRVKVLALIFNRIPLRLPAYVLLVGWIGLQLFNAYGGGDGSTAWWSHIGGFLAGAALVVPLRHKTVPLFDRHRPG
ncbi:MAG: rhomboid family intramembrane serine protease [Rhodospirillales bacterium]|nr:rhomboid family intramembrane serine protease [Rhodospirillales bacterium]